MRSIDAVAAVAALAASWAGCGEKRDSAQQTPTAVIEVSADQLWRDYRANEVAADDKYRGRSLRVAGTVLAIRKDVLDQPYLMLQTPDDFGGVQAHFDVADGLASTCVGQRVTADCTGDNVFAGMPQLRACALEDMPVLPPTTAPINYGTCERSPGKFGVCVDVGDCHAFHDLGKCPGGENVVCCYANPMK